MLKKTSILILIILITIPLIFAIDTSITIKSKIGYEISVNVLDSSSKDSIFYNTTTVENSGQINFSLSTDKRLVDIIIIARNNGKIVQGYPKEFLGKYTSNTIIIDLNEQPKTTPVIAKNETKNTSASANTTITAINATNITANISPVNSEISTNDIKQEIKQSNSKQTKINISTTGFAIDFSKINSKINWKIIIYFIITIFVLVSLFFGYKYIQKRRKSWKPDYKFLIRPKIIPKMSFAEERALRIAEEKIRRAYQEEIEKLKSRDQKIREAERKLEQDRLELERLKRGY